MEWPFWLPPAVTKFFAAGREVRLWFLLLKRRCFLRSPAFFQKNRKTTRRSCQNSLKQAKVIRLPGRMQSYPAFLPTAKKQSPGICSPPPTTYWLWNTQEPSTTFPFRWNLYFLPERGATITVPGLQRISMLPPQASGKNLLPWRFCIRRAL